MPISPERMKLFPGGSIRSAEWRAIRIAILERADHCCEGTPRYPDCRAENGLPHPVTGSRVVLTIMHMDHDPANNDPDNLKAACQRCHNTYDARFRQANRQRNQPANPSQSASGDTAMGGLGGGAGRHRLHSPTKKD